jgi:carboxylesterase type B
VSKNKNKILQRALDYEPWGDEVKDFTKFGQHCTQTSPIKGSDWYTLHQLGSEEEEEVEIRAKGPEDCLFTHVYTPNVTLMTIFMIVSN